MLVGTGVPDVRDLSFSSYVFFPSFSSRCLPQANAALRMLVGAGAPDIRYPSLAGPEATPLSREQWVAHARTVLSRSPFS